MKSDGFDFRKRNGTIIWLAAKGIRVAFLFSLASGTLNINIFFIDFLSIYYIFPVSLIPYNLRFIAKTGKDSIIYYYSLINIEHLSICICFAIKRFRLLSISLFILDNAFIVSLAILGLAGMSSVFPGIVSNV